LPYQTYNHNKLYALTIIDCFSKFAWVVPQTKKDATQVYPALQDILVHPPKILHTNNGGEFNNAQVQGLVQQLRIKHVKGWPYIPRSHSCIKWFNGTIKSMIEHVNDGNPSWHPQYTLALVDVHQKKLVQNVFWKDELLPVPSP
jgi:transposase InsO family protein